MKQKSLNLMSAEFVTITPEIAKSWMEGQFNRRLSNLVVKKYVSIMNEGKWLPCGDAICFDEDGKLINGFHRLTALIQYGNPLVFLVVRGLAKDMIYSIDTGRPRTLANMIEFMFGENVTNSRTLAALSRFVACYMNNGEITETGLAKATSKQMVDVAMQDSEWLQKCICDAKRCTKGCTIKSSEACLSFFLYCYNHTFLYEKAYAFVHSVNTGEMLKNGSVELALRRKIERMSGIGSNCERLEYLKSFFVAFEAYIRTGMAKRIVVPDNYKFKVLNPSLK